MHPDLERSLFIEHLTKLRQENERLAMTPGRDQRLVAKLKEQVERLETQNAVLRARLTAYGASAPLTVRSGGCRTPGSGLGTLSHEQVAEMHRRQMDGPAIEAAAGVVRSSLSRWRKANGYVQVWMPRESGGSAVSPAQEHVEGDHVVAEGRDDGEIAGGTAIGQRTA